MADDKNIQSGLSIANANLYGGTDANLRAILDAQETGMQALEQRYANPNWFNVAAGFFKPQLGGFGASLGSASQALGDWQEKQRENQMPIAKMRSDIALTQMSVGQRQKAAQMEEQRLADKLPVTPQYLAKLKNLAPGSSSAIAAEAELAAMTQNRTLESSEISSRANQYGQALKEIELRQAAHGYKTTEDFDRAMQAAKDMYGPKTPSVVRDPTTDPVSKGAGTGGAGTGGGDAAGAGTASADVAKPPVVAEKPIDPTKPITWKPGDKMSSDQLALFEKVADKDPNAKAALKDYYAQNPPAWSHKDYPVPSPAVPVTLDIEGKNEYLKANTKASTEYVNNIAALANDTSTVNRRENLLNMVDDLHKPTIQAWLARNSPASISSIIRNALTSESMPAFISKMVAGTNNLRPTDSKDMIADVQKYVQNLSAEQQYANQMQKAQTNKQLTLEQFSAIGPEMQPRAAILKAAEELHKIQRLSNLPYIFEPYASAGHTVTSMLNSDRLADYNKHWSALHRALPQFANKLEVPTALTNPKAYQPGFNYESLKPKKGE